MYNWTWIYSSPCLTELFRWWGLDKSRSCWGCLLKELLTCFFTILLRWSVLFVIIFISLSFYTTIYYGSSAAAAAAQSPVVGVSTGQTTFIKIIVVHGSQCQSGNKFLRIKQVTTKNGYNKAKHGTATYRTLDGQKTNIK